MGNGWMNGFVILPRRICEDWQWYGEPCTRDLFIHCIIKANWKSGEWRGVHYERGELITSLSSLSDELGFSVQNVRTALKHLISTGDLTSRATNKYRVITVVNYDSFQEGNRQIDNQITDGQQADNKQLTTDEEYKQLKKETIKYSKVAELYNRICVSFPRLTKLSDHRKKAIQARMRAGFTMDDFERLFLTAEESSFLKGGNEKNWTASFDWLIKDGNMQKVLEGNYKNRQVASKAKPTGFTNFQQRDYDFDELEKRLLASQKLSAT